MDTTATSPSFVAVPSTSTTPVMDAAEPTTASSHVPKYEHLPDVEDGTVGSTVGGSHHEDESVSFEEQKKVVVTKTNSSTSRMNAIVKNNPVLFSFALLLLVGVIVVLVLKCFKSGCDGNDNEPSQVSSSTMAFNATTDDMDDGTMGRNITKPVNSGCSPYKQY
jgi:hypothetical protein